MSGRDRIPGTSGGGVGSGPVFVKVRPLLNIVGAELTIVALTDELRERSPKTYGLVKINGWLHIMRELNGRPTTWESPTAKGTRVAFETIKTGAQAALAMAELTKYVGYFNDTYGTDIRIEGGVEREHGQE